jgi:hypothetical protein
VDKAFTGTVPAELEGTVPYRSGYLFYRRVPGTCVPEAGSHDDGRVVVLLVVVVDPSHGENPGVLVGLVVLTCTPNQLPTVISNSVSDSDRIRIH